MHANNHAYPFIQRPPRTSALLTQDLVKLIQAQHGSTGIVYAHQRKTCDWLAAKLVNAGVDAAAYHAGRDASERSRAQAQWMDGAFDCIVATVAFGMVRLHQAWHAALAVTALWPLRQLGGYILLRLIGPAPLTVAWPRWHLAQMRVMLQ